MGAGRRTDQARITGRSVMVRTPFVVSPRRQGTLQRRISTISTQAFVTEPMKTSNTPATSQ